MTVKSNTVILRNLRTQNQFDNGLKNVNLNITEFLWSYCSIALLNNDFTSVKRPKTLQNFEKSFAHVSFIL